MEILSFNNEDVYLNPALSDMVEVEADHGCLLFNELCHHLKIRVVDLNFEKIKGEIKAFERHESKVFWFDDLFADTFNFKSFFRPNLVLRYFLMLDYMNLSSSSQSIGITRYKNKSIFICQNRSVFEISSSREINEIRYFGNSTILKEVEVLLALMNNSLKTKLIQSLTKYQNLSGIELNKGEIVEKLISHKRLEEMIKKYVK